MKRAFTILELVIALFVVAIAVTFVWIRIHEEKVNMPESYAAWVKQTGNPKNLTYQEWRALMRTEGKKDVVVPLIIPVH